MTEITRVPLQPIAKGALGKLWLGVAAAVAVAGGIAWAAMPNMVKVTTLEAGEGPNPTLEDVAFINYKGKLANGKMFDSGTQRPFPLKMVVPGFTKALLQMQAGGKYTIEIPSELAYGSEPRIDDSTGEVKIPANSDLTFDVEVLGVMTGPEFEQWQQQMMMQMQQMRGQAPGMPGGPDGPAGRVVPAGN